MKKAFIVALTVIFVLSLTAVASANNDTKLWKSEEIGTGIVSPQLGYLVGWDSFYHRVENPGPGEIYKSLAELLIAETALTSSDLAGLSAAQIRDQAHILGITYYVTEVEGLTDQIWAVQVEANPGESGTLNQNFEAAYGPYGGELGAGEDLPAVVSGRSGDDFWYFQPDADGVIGVTTGQDFVGNYFNIDQLAATSGGITRRYIDISSPWSHAYIMEDTTVIGVSEISETFAMDNILPGSEVLLRWWDLF